MKKQILNSIVRPRRLTFGLVLLLMLTFGRIYTITVQVKDSAGNASTKTTTVTVPHDQKK